MDRWELVSPLGRGGNAEVWRAQDEDGRRVALKLLFTQKKKTEPYRRFCQEVRVQSDLKNRSGVLPIVDFSLAGGGTGPAWIAMPEAEGIREHLGTAPTLESVVAAVAEIASSLAELAANDIAHRDVKPENLYWFGGSYRLGDFGLVAHPDNDPITERGKPLGPRWYHAPEMLSSPDTSDGRPADVYSLAKTLWVLATGQQFPVPGEQRIDQPSFTLAMNVSHDRANYLDRLVERSTSLDPQSRPTMASFRDELLAWLSTESNVIEPGELTHIYDRLRTLTDGDRRKQERQLAELELATSAMKEFNVAVAPVADSLAVTPFDGPLWSQDNTIANLHTPLAPKGPTGPHSLAFIDGRGQQLNPPLQDLHFWAGIGVRLFTNGEVYLVAGFAMGPVYQPTVISARDAWAPVGSSKQEQAIRHLAARFSSMLSPSLQAFANQLDQMRRK